MEKPLSEKEQFLINSELNAHDVINKTKLSNNIDQYKKALEQSKNQFATIDLARKQAKNIKWKTIEHLDKYLETFEKKFIEKGGQVLWAETAEEALDFVKKIAKLKGAKTIIKAKSAVTEEIKLNAFLEKNKIEVVETDFGAYIQQLNSEESYHPVMSAINKSKEDIAQIIHEKLSVDAKLSPGKLTNVLKSNLRNKFSEVAIGITGANFLIAEEGAVCITENEGNASMITAFPKTHIVITGIEKVIPTLKDLELFLPLLSTYGTGQKLTTYNNILTGPRQQGEVDGPEDMYVVLLDNGRSNLLREEVRESLFCIHCGACSNVSPVFKNIGGPAYGSSFTGPIGAVVTPHLEDMHTFGHLSYASTLSGSGAEICPIHIDLHGMLVKNRKIFVDEGNDTLKERMAWRVFKRAMLHRKLLNKVSVKMKNILFEKLFQTAWGERRTKIVFSEKSFNQQWKEKKRKKKK